MVKLLEPEVMDNLAAAIAYDSIDFTEVNQAFAKQAIKFGQINALVVDACTGTARILVLLCQMSPAWQPKAIDLAENMLRIGSEHVTPAA